MSAPQDEFEGLDVEIVHEVWNTYDLEDGARMKARAILTKVLWPKGLKSIQGGEPVELGAAIQNIIVIFAPTRLRGSPTPNQPSVEAARKMKQEEIGVVDSKEEWNLYRLPDNKGGLKMKMVVSSIFRVVGVFNADGDPYYIVNSSAVVGPASSKDIVSR